METDLNEALDEIDRQEDEKAANAYMATGIKIDQTKYREQIREFEDRIEQSTKRACNRALADKLKTKLKRLAKMGITGADLSLGETEWRQAIDSVGGKP